MVRHSQRRCLYDWSAVQRYFDAGHRFVACQQAFGFSHTARVKAVKRGQLRIPTDGGILADRRRKYDWAAVQRYYDLGHSYRECRARFGFAGASWRKAVERGKLAARARQAPLSKVLMTSRSRTTIKRRLIQAGVLLNACGDCGLTEWRGKPLSIQIDHRNGIRDDHRLENLRMLCPNCHSQTATFGAKNRKRSQVVQR
jgi:ribosomal protein S27AE